VTVLAASLLIAGALLLLFLLFAAKGVTAARELPSTSDAPLLEAAADFPACPPHFAASIFSPGDSKFVSSIKSPQLQKLFRHERKVVALLWVRQTSAAIQRIMREHAQVARASSDLQPATELKLALLFAGLMLICGVIFVVVWVAGPLRIGRLALYADAHLQRLGQVQQSFKASTSARQFHSAGSS
jgi:hypothetical protein